MDDKTMFKYLIKNKILFWLGAIHLILFLCLLTYYNFNKAEVLGINSTVKPMKFALSIWLYSWTMGIILNYVSDQRKVKLYSWMAVVAMGFEQAAITFQALRGQLSHFNRADAFGIILFALMGIFILTITLWTAYITYIFFKQKEFRLKPAVVLSIKFGLVYFVIFSLFGGYISSLKGHTIGASDGSKGIWFLNWSTTFGDLRVAHFFGLHSLQLIPIFGYLVNKYFNTNKALQLVKLFSLIYLIFIIFTLFIALNGLPFIHFSNIR